MRNAFVKALLEEARKDPNLFLICGDLGYGVLDAFKAEFPDRFINAGIAEQTMVGLAVGMALTGKRVFVYSIVNFAVARCLEQIRNDVCYHNANVTIVSVGGGLPYGTHGYTHLGVEDIAMMRTLPNMSVYVPADRLELELCMSLLCAKKGPSYLRMAKGGESDIHSHVLTATQQAGSLIELFPKQKINIVASGTILSEAVACATQCHAQQKPIGLYSLPHADEAALSQLTEIALTSDILITLEEHVIQGGIGSLIAEHLCEHPIHAKLLRKGVSHKLLLKTGDQAFLRRENHLCANQLVEWISTL